MSPTRLPVIVGTILLLFACVGAIDLDGQGAQQVPPRRISVTITQLKPEMIDAYIALVRDEGVPAEKKANVPWSATYRPVFSEPYSMVTLRPMANFAQYDQPDPLVRALGQEGQRRFMAKVRPMMVSARTKILTVQPRLSIESGATTLANLLMVQEIKILPGKTQEYDQLLGSTILPALRKDDVKDYWVHTNYGSPNYRTIVRPLATMAELDRGINARDTVERVNGQEAGQKLNQQVGLMLDTAETTILRLVSEISYAPSPH